MSPTATSPDEGWVEPALLSDALRLACAFAFEMGEDGRMDFSDTDGIDALLGGLKTDPWNTLLSEPDAAQRQSAIANLTQVGAHYDLHYSIGDGLHLRETAEAQTCAEGRATLIRGVVRQHPVPRTDPETGLANRNELDKSGTQLAGIGDRIGIPVHLLRLRLSNLDRLAHDFGDDLRAQLLREAGERLQAALRKPDFVARLDGNDFAAVTLNSDPDTLGLRLRAAVTAERYETLHGPLALELDTARSPLKSVSSALDSTAQDLSGDEVPATVPDPDMPTVEDAVVQNLLSLAFQPIVHAQSHKLHHFEVLLRLRGPGGHIGTAFPFIVEAERQGTVQHIDRFVLAAAKPYLLADPALELAVNVSAGTIGHDAHAQDYLNALRALGDLAGRLTLEMTETLAVDDPAKAERFSADVQALGCRFAIDDFASGHTSFRTLLGVDADCIKIDGSLVRGVALDDNKQAFIRMMVDLARTVSVETVAEMIEDRADADILARLGVDYLQGYYFGKPGPEPIWLGLSDQ